MAARSKIGAVTGEITPSPDPIAPSDARVASSGPVLSSTVDFSVANHCANEDLRRFAEFFDAALSGPTAIHLALFWPHLPPAAILPWALRELGREPEAKPLRTLFVNSGRSALAALGDVDALTSKLGALGVRRSGQVSGKASVSRIASDAHVHMFLGNPKNGGIASIPVSSILPHTVAMDDGIYWRNFDEKALRGFKRHYPEKRLDAIRQHLASLTSFQTSRAFAFLLPGHLEGASRRDALTKLKDIDLVVIDMTSQAVRGDAGSRLQDILAELDTLPVMAQRRVLIICDCPLRWSHLKRAVATRQKPGQLGTRVQTHRLLWRSRARGFETVAGLREHRPPTVEAIASAECILATRLWEHSHRTDSDELSLVLAEGARALKAMALAASGADEILRPYGDVHDAYHRIKRERHSFVPHYNDAMRLIAAGASCDKRDVLLADLEEAHSLASALCAETPLGRYLKRVLGIVTGDVLIVLRHAEDAQLARERLGDYLTEPGRFQRTVPEVRVTTPARYAEDVVGRTPTMVIWAASAVSGARAYIGDAATPSEFRLLVAGQDAVMLRRALEIALRLTEYAPYHHRVQALRDALPWAPREFGGLRASFALDADRVRKALPFTAGGHLVLDGYGKIAAGPGSTFYVLDPISQRLTPREARSIDIGDGVFVMPDSIREEIEGLLREKDEKGRTLEQAMVDHYKAIVKAGIEKLERSEGRPVSASRVHDMLFERNPALPAISIQAVDYWLRAGERLDVDTPFAAQSPQHFAAFIELMGAGTAFTQGLAEAVRTVRSILRRDGNVNRAIFDMLLLDPDSLVRRSGLGFQRLDGLRTEALESIYPLIEKHLEPSERALQSHAIAERST